MTEKNYTVSEVADICRVTEFTVREWLKDPNHPLEGHKPGGRWLVKESALTKYLESTNG